MRPLALLSLASALAASLLWSAGAQAHKVGLSKGEYRLQKSLISAEMIFQNGELAAAAPEADRDRNGELSEAELRDGKDAIERAVVKRIEATADGKPCPGSLLVARSVEADGVELGALLACPDAPREVSLSLQFFEQMSHGHRHLGAIEAGGAPLDFIAYRGSRPVTLAAGAGAARPPEGGGKHRPPATAAEMFKLGVEHILTGYDHLVFLLGLVLVGGRWRSLLAVVTAFTVAHSITLALAALGVWAPSPRVVEPAIALSIAYVGVENFFIKDAARRWRVTFPFGLVHGFGFAGALAEAALPRAKVPLALLTFNLGVEAGQIAVLLLLLPLLAALRKVAWFARHGVRAVSVAVVIAGLGWFLERVLGG